MMYVIIVHMNLSFPLFYAIVDVIELQFSHPLSNYTWDFQWKSIELGDFGFLEAKD